MNGHEEERFQKFLREAVPPVEADSEPARDLWPTVLRSLSEQSTKPGLFDLALLVGLAGLVVIFPSAIPIFLYYL